MMSGALHSQLENDNILILIIFLIGEQSKNPAGFYACAANHVPKKSFVSFVVKCVREGDIHMRRLPLIFVLLN